MKDESRAIFAASRKPRLFAVKRVYPASPIFSIGEESAKNRRRIGAIVPVRVSKISARAIRFHKTGRTEITADQTWNRECPRSIRQRSIYGIRQFYAPSSRLYLKKTNANAGLFSSPRRPAKDRRTSLTISKNRVVRKKTEKEKKKKKGNFLSIWCRLSFRRWFVL